jgi:hypothetical protein
MEGWAGKVSRGQSYSGRQVTGTCGLGIAFDKPRKGGDCYSLGRIIVVSEHSVDQDSAGKQTAEASEGRENCLEATAMAQAWGSQGWTQCGYGR